MKKLFLLCLGLAPCAALAASNKISMVTYFPVPYVAYSQVNAEQMDIGLTNTCDMKLGCDSITIPLTANTVNLAHGRLDLDGGRGIVGDSLTLGNGEGGGQVHFKDVRIQTGNMESVNVGTAMKVSTLNLFGKQFPSCIGANAASNGQMSWQKLKLAGAGGDELYLVCGGEGSASSSGDCSLSSYKLGHKSECCPSAPYTDTTCWKAVSTPEKWGWGVPTMISNKACTGQFYVKSAKPDNTDATSWCMTQSNIQWANSPISGVDNITFTLAGGNVGPGCQLKQPGRDTCSEGEAYFSNGEHTAAMRKTSCTINGTKCTCTYNEWEGVPCIKTSNASTSYERNGW